ncbi:uracil-DNA glycosylase [Streptomyces pseudoechinosporeus]
MEVIEPVQQIAQPVTGKEGSLLHPVIKPLRHGHHASPASRRRYPDPETPAHAVGLSFSVAPEVRPLPGSLINIYRELSSDLGLPQPSNGDLTPWTEQGVLLLNRALTTAPRRPAAHRGKGWEEVTEQAIRALAARGKPLVSILWGRDTRNLRPLLGDLPSVESAHPSPMSADRGFFGSRPFSRANELLVRQGGQPVDWRLP